MPESKTPGDYENLLRDAIRKRDELNVFIKVLQEMLGGKASAEVASASLQHAEAAEGSAVLPITDPATTVFPGMFFGQSQPEASRLLLEKVRPPLKTRVIVDCLEKGGLKVGGKNPATNLWGVLNRNKETFVLVPKAGWALAEWYQPHVIAKMRKEGGESGENDKENEGDQTK